MVSGVAETTLELGAIDYPVEDCAGGGQPAVSAAAEMSDSVYVRESGRLGYRVAKRLFDIVFSAVVIVVLFIPSIILCIVIVLETPGNPIFIQRRVGRHGKNGSLYTFPLLKFRSMYKDADSRLNQLKDRNEASGPLFKMKDDPRITKVGRFIRKHSIDEFPQFINVFCGHMSVCGPRPPLLDEVEQYSSQMMGRLCVKPGATGYWQIDGRRMEFNDMLASDLAYIDERSILVDLQIIAKTIGVVITGKGAF